MAEPRTARRALLKRVALVFGGVAGLGLAGKAGIESRGSSNPGGALTLSLHGANWRMTYPDRPRGVLPSPGQRSASFGELLDGPQGAKVGEFYASSFQFGAPFGPSEVAAAAMETHQFNLGDGTIIGVGTVPGWPGSQSVHAIIGGTGRYEGASGSYVARQDPLVPAAMAPRILLQHHARRPMAVTTSSNSTASTANSRTR